MRTLTIKAAFVDKIQMLQHRKKELKKVGTRTKVIEKDLNSLNKEQLANILNSCNSYYFEDNCIYYKVDLTPQEKKQLVQEINRGIDYDISRLINWCNQSKEHKEQIFEYLNRHSIFIEGINK